MHQHDRRRRAARSGARRGIVPQGRHVVDDAGAGSRRPARARRGACRARRPRLSGPPSTTGRTRCSSSSAEVGPDPAVWTRRRHRGCRRLPQRNAGHTSIACVSLRKAPTSSMSAASTRPGSGPIAEEELRRVRPVVEDWPRGRGVSLDTRRAAVARASSMPGRGLSTTCRPCGTTTRSCRWLWNATPPVVLMHRRGRPEDRYAGPAYETSSRTSAASCSTGPRPARLQACARPHRARSRPRLRQERRGGRRPDRRRGAVGRRRLSHAGRFFAQELHRPADGHRRAGRRDPASVWLAVEAARRGAAILRVHDVGEPVRPSRSAWRCGRVRRMTRSLFGTDGIRGIANTRPDDGRDRAAPRPGGGPDLQARQPSPPRRHRQGHAPLRAT